jgi:cobaltochelatase CobN
MPEVPVERVKAIWKAEKLNRVVQLTVSGCLGPCDVPNVAVIVTAEGLHWYGLLDGDGHYDALIAWALAVSPEGEPIELPVELDANRLRRFAQGNGHV